MAIFGDDGSAERRALEIAREIVANELESINRMHSRTLAYITAYTTVMALLFAALGWLGYERLQGIVLEATMKNVQAQTQQRVNHQVDADLQKMDVPGLITNKIADFATSDLRNALTQEIEHGPVHEDIRRVALSAAGGIRSQAVQPSGPQAPPTEARSVVNGRSLTDDQQNRFRALVLQRHDPPLWIKAGQPESANALITRNVFIFVTPNNAEALAYAQQIKALLKSIGWTSDVIADPFVSTIEDRRFAFGLHVVINGSLLHSNSYSQRSNEAVNSIFACILDAGIPGFTAPFPSTMKRDNPSFIAIGAQH